MDEKHRSFLNLLLPVQVRLTNYVRAMTADADDAKDVMSETVLAAFEQFEEIVKPDSFVFYLFKIARRKTKRMQWRRRLFRSHTDADVCVADVHTCSPEMFTDIVLLHDALARLSHVQREAVTMHVIAGLSIEEVAQVQGTSANTVKARVKRGRARLAVLLGAADDAASEAPLVSKLAPSLCHDATGDGG